MGEGDFWDHPEKAKTVVAEFAIWQARNAGLRAIYTAPLKALSNQKYRDFRAHYGPEEVGLLTGDIVENPRAPSPKRWIF